MNRQIQSLRKSRGLIVRDLSYHAGVADASVYAAESPRVRGMRWSTLIKILEALGPVRLSVGDRTIYQSEETIR